MTWNLIPNEMGVIWRTFNWRGLQLNACLFVFQEIMILEVSQKIMVGKKHLKAHSGQGVLKKEEEDISFYKFILNTSINIFSITM